MEFQKRSKLLKRALFILPIGLLIVTFTLYSSVDSKSNHPEVDYFEKNETNTKVEIFQGERVVHLDLKGAPPRISYYEKLFPFLSKIGATGILIEYEDMFPYTGEFLQHVPAHNAYTHSDISIINNLAEKNNLTVIPLVQTFGHLEFLLKLKRFRFLREVAQYPQVICPTNNMTIRILYNMLNQVIRAHPKSKYIHIGADEVYHIGKCSRCQDIMFKEQMTVRQLFLSHIKRITTKIKKEHPKLTILMWDDEFRDINLEELKQSAINLLVVPVVWKYTQHVLADLGFALFDKYVNAFETIWFASAFKGATGPSKYLTTVSHHMANHHSWMDIYSEYKDKINIDGILITGWQRYDHFAVLCELLPVGLPSLAFSLNILMSHSNNADTYGIPYEVQDLLDCDNPVGVVNTHHGAARCNFPGGDILDTILDFHKLLEKYKSIKSQSAVQGWLTNYNNQHNYSNTNLVDSVLNDVTMILGDLGILKAQIQNAMIRVYDKFTVDEWVETHVNPISDEMEDMLHMFNKLILVSDWPRRPL